MNERILELIKSPTLLEKNDLRLIQQKLESEPYMQSIHALRLLYSYHFEPENYQSVLSQTAAYTTDKKVLYQLVFGKQEKKVEISINEVIEELQEEKEVENKNEQNLNEISLEEPENQINPIEEMESNINSEWKPMVIEMSPLDSFIQIEKSEEHTQHIILEKTEEELEKPKTETHSEIEEKEQESNIPEFFNVLQNWIKREKYHLTEEHLEEIPNRREEAIDKFIESNYTVIKNQKDAKDNFPKESPIKEKSDDISHLMTETLAKLYLEQKLYSKSIQAYEILQQKYPERKKEFELEVEKIKELRVSKN